MISWSVFLPAALLVSLVPGANQLLGLRNAAVHGPRPALLGVAGRFVAFAVLAGLVALGLGALLVGSSTAFEVLRWLGVGYLAWLGLSTLLRARRIPDDRGLRDPDDVAGVGSWRIAREEFLTALSNPKALLLFAAFLPQFAPSGTGAGTLLVLAAAYVAVEAVSAVGYLVLGLTLARAGSRIRITRRRLEQAGGWAFLGLAGYLAVARRP